MATAKQKHDRQARVGKAKVAGTITPVETPQPEVTAKTRVRTPGQPSIKQTITQLLQDGRSTTEISDAIQTQFPGTAAAAKPKIHISFYRSKLRKAGLLAAARQETQDSVRLNAPAEGEATAPAKGKRRAKAKAE